MSIDETNQKAYSYMQIRTIRGALFASTQLLTKLHYWGEGELYSKYIYRVKAACIARRRG